MSSKARTAPLSPVLLAGFVLRPLPLAPLQPVLRAALGLLGRRHPGLFDRVTEMDATVHIEPVDLPFAFALRLGRRPALRAVAKIAASGAAATIRGPLLALIDLLEGRVDGDALFFGQGLSVSGDTEVIVGLRNAVDAAEIDLARDLSGPFGPLAPVLGRAARGVRQAVERLSADVDTVAGAVTAPLEHRDAARGDALRTLEARVDRLEQRLRRRRAVAS